MRSQVESLLLNLSLEMMDTAKLIQIINFAKPVNMLLSVFLCLWESFVNKSEQRSLKKYELNNSFPMSDIFWIPYKIIPSKKRKRSVWFRMKSNWLEVIVPFWTKEKIITELLSKKENWILTSRKKISQKLESPTFENQLKKDIPTLQYLWKSYPIEIIYASKENGIIFEGNILKVFKKWNENSEENIQKYIQNWYKKEATLFLKERTSLLAQKYNFSQIGEIFVKSYKSKYGMCKWKDIYLDYKILAFEEGVIHHIILHELTHLIYKHHQASFRKRLSELDPDFKKNRDFLKGKIS